METGITYNVPAELMRYHAIVEKDFSTSVHIDVFDSETSSDNPLIELDFPINTLASNGLLTVSVAAGNATSENMLGYFPGEFTGIYDKTNGVEYPLDTVAFAELKISDEAENLFTTLANPVSISMRLPDIYQLGGERAGGRIQS